MIMNQRKEVFKTACQFMDAHNVPRREFEFVYLTFDLVCSAACYAQLKRHRLVTLTAQEYDPGLGLTIPNSIDEIRETPRLRELAHRSEELFNRIRQSASRAAQYVLINAHRRRVLLSINARELYHLTRLREDKTAQWDIRDKTRKMVELAKHIMPLTLLLTGGKDQYPALYQELFGRQLPASVLPGLPEDAQTIALVPEVETRADEADAPKGEEPARAAKSDRVVPVRKPEARARRNSRPAGIGPGTRRMTRGRKPR
jgi:hypothetical protein